VGGGDGDDIRQIIAGGVEGILIVVLTDAEEVAVAGRGHVDVTGVAGVADRIVQGLREGITAVAIIGDLGAMGDRIVQGEDDVDGGAAVSGIYDLQGHDLDVPVDAGDADAVVTDGADGAGHVRAVVVVVHRIAVVIGEVIPVNVVDVAVAVVIDAGPAVQLGR